MWKLNRLARLVKGFKDYRKFIGSVHSPVNRNEGNPPSQNSEKVTRHNCRVAILGALTNTGRILALLLKQNPLISHIYLHAVDPLHELVTDLSHIDTHTSVTGFSGDDLQLAVQNADIIIMLGLDEVKPDAHLKSKLNVEGKRLIYHATVCSLFAPKAIFVDCVVPISVTLPLISDIYRNTEWYHPGKVIGSVALQQMQVNSFYATQCKSDPSLINVPLLGAPDDELVLPLFSRATPYPLQLSKTRTMINLYHKMEQGGPAKSNLKPESVPSGNAFAINRLVSTIALGLLGDSAAITTAFVRTNFIETCKYLVSTVKFGMEGISHNYGVPKLTRFEINFLERVIVELQKREAVASEYLNEHEILASEEQAVASETLYFPSIVQFTTPMKEVAK